MEFGLIRGSSLLSGRSALLAVPLEQPDEFSVPPGFLFRPVSPRVAGRRIKTGQGPLGGTGIHSRLKIERRKACRFKSDRGYTAKGCCIKLHFPVKARVLVAIA